jgi:pseudouridine-5'-monophosphatase
MSENNKRSQFKNVSHIIFDLDGLLIDTEVWALNNLNSVLKSYGKECSIEFYSKQLGIQPFERVKSFIEEFKLCCNPENFFNDWIQECFLHLEDIKLMPGVKRLIEHLHNHKIPKAIATAGKTAEYFAKISRLQDIFEDNKYFEHVVKGDDSEVKRLKPYPDIFQVCAARFSQIPDPQNVLVFEDSLTGVSAAIAAGMQCVWVCDTRFEKIENSNATIVIKNLEEFRPELFGLPNF